MLLLISRYLGLDLNSFRTRTATYFHYLILNLNSKFNELKLVTKELMGILILSSKFTLIL